ncbi:hypothetical protein [Streptomyces coeruleorubidus]|uniref:hypothetical protein n=1 Tax=Streptomyces coeruleorubidus TaxID=116188 RepID=UPI0019B25251|nr:hypothetical protein GCM10010244_83120 [Streptomyces bellus]
MARDRNNPAILAQLLLSPMLDDCNDSPSAQQMRGVGIWDSSSNETGWNALLGDGVRGGPDVSPYTAPSRAADLSSLPCGMDGIGRVITSSAVCPRTGPPAGSHASSVTPRDGPDSSPCRTGRIVRRRRARSPRPSHRSRTAP